MTENYIQAALNPVRTSASSQFAIAAIVDESLTGLKS
jgi:hypothetical protein